MSYDTVKSGIATRLNTLGYVESSQAIDFKNANENEFGNRYIIRSLSGEMKDEMVGDRFYDMQEWQVLIAFDRSENNDITQLDAVHRAKDLILADLDDPVSWEGIAKLLKYKSWEVTEENSYYVLNVRLSVLDEYIY